MFEVPLSRDKIAIVLYIFIFFKKWLKNSNGSFSINAGMLPKVGRFDYQNL